MSFLTAESITKVDGIRVTPKPHQKPHPPVYVATNSPDTFGMVGFLGHNILVAPVIYMTEEARAGSQGRGRDRAMQLSYEQICNEFGAVGEPEECLAKLQELQHKYNAQEFACWFEADGRVPHKEVTKSMRLFAERVMPHLR